MIDAGLKFFWFSLSIVDLSRIVGSNWTVNYGRHNKFYSIPIPYNIFISTRQYCSILNLFCYIVKNSYHLILSIYDQYILSTSNIYIWKMFPPLCSLILHFFWKIIKCDVFTLQHQLFKISNIWIHFYITFYLLLSLLKNFYCPTAVACACDLIWWI